MTVVPLTLFLARRDNTLPPEEGPDIKAEIEAAYQRGVSDGIAKGRQAYDCALALKQRQYESSLEEERRQWNAAEGTLLAQHLTAALGTLSREIAGTVARILKPFVKQALIDDALSKLAIEIEKFISDDDAIKLKVSGPSDLVAQLSKVVPPHIPLMIEEDSAPEIKLYVDKTVIETRLKEWLEGTGVKSHGTEEER